MTALPKPDPRAKAPHPDDFAAWCESPVTRFVAAAFEAAAVAQREAWSDVSWSAGQLDPIQHATLRARADAYMAFLETPLEGYVKLTENL